MIKAAQRAATKILEVELTQNDNFALPLILFFNSTSTASSSRRSKRTIRPSVRLILLNEIYLIESKEHYNDPFTYQEAMIDKDIENSKRAMESEMYSMYTNQVWTLVDKPEGIKPIGCK